MCKIITFILLLFFLAFFTKPDINDLDYVFQKDMERFHDSGLSGYMIAKLYNTISIKWHFDYLFLKLALIIKPDGTDSMVYMGIFNNWKYVFDIKEQKLNCNSYRPNFKDNSVKYDGS